MGGDRCKMASRALLERGEAEEDFFLRLGPEAIKAGDFVVLADFFQIGERGDLELFVEGLDFFRAEAGNVEKFE